MTSDMHSNMSTLYYLYITIILNNNVTIESNAVNLAIYLKKDLG